MFTGSSAIWVLAHGQGLAFFGSFKTNPNTRSALEKLKSSVCARSTSRGGACDLTPTGRGFSSSDMGGGLLGELSGWGGFKAVFFFSFFLFGCASRIF